MGNFLYRLADGDISQVKVIGQDKNVRVQGSGGHLFEQEELRYFAPLALNRFYLLRCGFEMKTDESMNLMVYEGYVSFKNFKNSKPLLALEIDGRRMPLFNIKFLHQLQNLYFALTREELTVNL